MTRLTRREAVRAGLVWGGVAFLGRTGGIAEALAAQACDGLPLGELLGTVPLHGAQARHTTFATLLGGSGLDARLFTDLSRLDRERLITPTPEVFVRTAAPRALRSTAADWSIVVNGFTGEKRLSLDRLRREAQPMGAHLIECSGNADPDNFGLMSVAEWSGVPLAPLLTSLKARPGTTGVLVSGVDDTLPSRSSNPGASWVFPMDRLAALGAFLAVAMNGEPLTADHGAPVRLVVPGWYGCSWIKWVDAIQAVDESAPTTLQMAEFSLRTHQSGVPLLARDYTAPEIDLAATPIRVERRRVDGRLEYRVVGIVWGGDRAAEQLAIRFTAGETPRPFAICPRPRTHRTWSLWDYRWRPTAPGVYNIALSSPDPAIRTRRLDVSYYVRRAVIDEV